MANVTIRNLDDEVLALLKKRAEAHHRSLEAELREILSAAVRRPSGKAVRAKKDLRAQAERIAAMTPKDRPQTDSVKLLREDRRR